MTEYKINPVKGIEALNKRKGGTLGINDINDKCYSISAAFSDNSGNSYMINQDLGEVCDSYIEKQRHKFYGTGRCGHQGPFRPVIWNQVPHYFPPLLKKGLTPEKALLQCKEYCESDNECKDACRLHYDSVEKFMVENPLLSQDKLPMTSRVERSIIPVIIIVLSLGIMISMRFMK